MPLKWCLFNRKTSFNGQCCLLIDFSDVYFSLTARFRTVGPQTPVISQTEGCAGTGGVYAKKPGKTQTGRESVK